MKKENVLEVIDEDSEEVSLSFFHDNEMEDNFDYPLSIYQEGVINIDLDRTDVKNLLLLCRRVLKV